MNQTASSGKPPATSTDAQPEEFIPSRRVRELTGENLVLGFGKTEVVHGVDLSVRPGTVTALVGPNGSGKSTLLRSMARLHAPESGRILIGGDSTQDVSADQRDATSFSAKEFAREVTLFAQTRVAPAGLSVREVVDFGRHPHRKRFAVMTPHDREAVENAMDVTGLSGMADRSVGELSGGEQQRVWLACCLAQETGVVLLDEPTNHLDLRYQTETLDLIRDLAEDQGVAVGVVLHDLDHAARVADHVVMLSAGAILAAGDALNVLTAANISTAYGLPVDVTLDERSGHLRIDPIGRHDLRRQRR